MPFSKIGSEEVEKSHSPPCEPSSSGSKEDPGRGSISSGDGTELAQHALVPTISTDVGGLPPCIFQRPGTFYTYHSTFRLTTLCGQPST